MFKSYFFKWYFILTGVLTSATLLALLLRNERLYEVRWWEYLLYVCQLGLTLLVCWLIQGYFLLNEHNWLNTRFKHVVGIFLASLVTVVFAYIYYLIFPLNRLNDTQVGYDNVSDFAIHYIGAFLASLISYVVFYSVYTNSALQNTRLQNEILEQAHLRAQLLSLQQQISPHFLFNSLSTLKTLTSEQPTKDYIIQLSAVYRYVLNYNRHYLTPLKEELSFIRSYLYIMTTRYEESLQVSINVPDEFLEMMIPPLSVQLLIENAIKHNSVSPERPLQINIQANNTPALIITNNLQLKKVPEEGTGTGINNISERYKLLMQKTVEVSKDSEQFSVTLPLMRA
ncbi:histidine kinase [Mucilaginibacter roseus]|uniref:Histidine kinase n=1 Tax=Mucilaginibacter roseus TaxID=1528868 RepID=A0ABS8U673_9SPHI|nr:histidine kinase [Mucilaginibacter roseus]MCD8741008.1 histidine kinase [Mucilaginibacter roseus]